jgi:hypothetical protein
VIIVGLISHVAFKSIAYGSSSVRPLLDVIVYWTILGVCLGSAMGVAGVLSHSDLTWIRAYAWALPPAVAAIEAVAIAMGTAFLRRQDCRGGWRFGEPDVCHRGCALECGAGGGRRNQPRGLWTSLVRGGATRPSPVLGKTTPGN